MSDAQGPRIGRVVCVSGAQVVAAIEPDSPAPLRKGQLVKLPMADTAVFGLVSGLSIPVPGADPASELRLAELELIGEVPPPGVDRAPAFRRGVSGFPALGDPVLAADRQDLACVHAPSATSTVRIGTLHLDPAQPALISPDALRGDPVAILGAARCGKSCAVSLILQRLLERPPETRVLLLDTHDEYAHAFADGAELLGPEDLQLPYWLLDADELAAAVLGDEPQPEAERAVSAIVAELIPLARKRFQGDRSDGLSLTDDTPVPYRLSDLLRLLDEIGGRRNGLAERTPERWLKSRLERLAADRRLAFMFGSVTVRDDLVEILSRLLPIGGRPVTIVELSGVPSAVREVVVAVLCRTAFELASWSRGARPMLVVCEEADRYAPAGAKPGSAPARRTLRRIAEEGRGCGVGLWLVSRRPAALAPAILAQCATTLAFRQTGAGEREILRGLLDGGAGGLSDLLPALGEAEAIVAGAGLALPLRLRFDDLPLERRPQRPAARAADPEGGESLVAEAVERWRRRQR